MKFHDRHTRKQSGSAISEFGPALFIFFVFMFFPVIDLISMGFAYTSTCTLNDLQMREAAREPKTQAMTMDGLVQEQIPQQWLNSGLSFLVASQSNIQTSLNYRIGMGAVYVSVSTTASFRPLLTIPFLNGIPGLGAPVTFTVTSTRPLEDPRMYAQ